MSRCSLKSAFRRATASRVYLQGTTLALILIGAVNGMAHSVRGSIERSRRTADASNSGLMAGFVMVSVRFHVGPLLCTPVLVRELHAYQLVSS